MNAAALLSAMLFLVAMPRSYGYPKLIVYAVAAVLWWRYVSEAGHRRERSLLVSGPRLRSIGVRTMAPMSLQGVMLATMAAHGLGVKALGESARAGIVAIALVAPWLMFAVHPDERPRPTSSGAA